MSSTAENSPAPESPLGGAKSASTEGSVDLGGKYEIYPGSPLGDFVSPGGKTYLVLNRRDRRTDSCAVILDGPLSARLETLNAFRGIEHPALLRLLDWGVVDWPLDNCRRFALIFDRPGGRRLFETMAGGVTLPEEAVLRVLLPSLLAILKECNARGITCGGIRPTNIYFKDGSATGFSLGDCVSTPVGFSQPSVVETIERGMTEPAGKGPGAIADDLYSLGVTLLLALMGENPVATMSDADLLQAKMERGTFQVIVGSHRLPPSALEPLRGLTFDDPRMRWTLADLDNWLQGRRLTPKNTSAPRRGLRPLEFDGKEYWFNRAIASGLTQHPNQAAQLIERGDLDKWIRRSLGDDPKADLLRKVINGTGNRGGTHEDRVVSRVAIALDPSAPIRFRGRAVLPEGLGTALAYAIAEGESPQPLAEIILAQLPSHWAASQPEARPEHVVMVQQFDAMRAVLEQTGPGQGIERVLYDLNPAIPCLSPIVRAENPLTCTELLAAMELAAQRPDKGKEPVDRHLIAFLASRNNKLSDRLLPPLAVSSEPDRRVVALLTILSETQQRFGPASLPNLYGWLLNLMEPAFKRYHARSLQDELRNEARRAARQGDISTLLRLVDSPETLKKDERSFSDAKKRHDSLTRQIEKITKSIADKTTITETTGRQVTAVIASLVGAVVMAGIVAQMLLGRG